MNIMVIERCHGISLMSRSQSSMAPIPHLLLVTVTELTVLVPIAFSHCQLPGPWNNTSATSNRTHSAQPGWGRHGRAPTFVSWLNSVMVFGLWNGDAYLACDASRDGWHFKLPMPKAREYKERDFQIRLFFTYGWANASTFSPTLCLAPYIESVSWLSSALEMRVLFLTRQQVQAAD